MGFKTCLKLSCDGKRKCQGFATNQSEFKEANLVVGQIECPFSFGSCSHATERFPASHEHHSSWKMSTVYCFLDKERVTTLFLNAVAGHTLSHTKLHTTAATLQLHHETFYTCPCSLLELWNYCTHNRLKSVLNARFPAQASGESFYTAAATHARTHKYKLSQATNTPSHTLPRFLGGAVEALLF